MDSMSPLAQDPKDIVQVDGDEITANLFKNVSLPPKIDKLETYLRIRPITGPRSKIYFINGENVITVKKEKKDSQNYEFSKIFTEDTTQETVYRYCAQPLVTKFIEGNDSLLFAYGTTSSGKSYTIRGDDTNPGIIQRVLRSMFTSLNVSQEPLYKRKNFREFELLNSDEKLFEINIKQRYLNFSQKLANNLKSINHFKAIEAEKDSSFDENTTYVFWVSFLEFYNEKPIDLLALDGDFQKSLKIYENGAVHGLKHVFVSSDEEAFRIFLYGQARLNDHIKSNGLNLKSSRSHSMFTVTAIAVNTHNQRALRVNNLAVCDLAGNERSSKTQSRGERLKEAGKINTSLLALQNVIKGLRTSQKNKKDNSFVSYRDSKLTRMFKPFLDGTGFASMIINMNPSANLVDETVGSLDFSATAAEIVVSTEDSRRQLQDSWKRLSQQWITSKQRWSSFAQSRKSLKINVGDTLLEEIEEEEVSVNEIDGEIQRLSLAVESGVDPSELEYYKSRIEILNAQIEMMNQMVEDTETEQFQREMEIRNELADKNRELNENLIQQHAAEKEKLRKENDEFMEKRLQIVHNQRQREKAEAEKKIENLEKQLFELSEKYIEVKCKLLVYVSKEFRDKSTSTNIVTLDAGMQTDTQILNQEYSLRDDSLSLINMALPMEPKTYCDALCGGERFFEDKCVETDVEVKKMQDQNVSFHPEADEKSTSMFFSIADNWTQSDTVLRDTTERSSNTTFREVVDSSVQFDDSMEVLSNCVAVEVLSKSVQCENTAEQLNTSLPEVFSKSVQCEAIEEPAVEMFDKSIQCQPEIHSAEQSSNTSIREVINQSIQCVDLRDQSMDSTLKQLSKSIQCDDIQEISIVESAADSVDESETKETVELCSVSIQTEDYESTNERLQKQIKEKDVIISLKEDIIDKLRHTIKSKDDEIEKMSASSVASSQQSMLSSYVEPYRPKKPKIMISDPVDQVYLQTMSAREKEMKIIGSVKKNVVEEKKSVEIAFQGMPEPTRAGRAEKISVESVRKISDASKKIVESVRKISDTSKKSVESVRKNSQTARKSVESLKRDSDVSKKSIEAVKKVVEPRKMRTRKKANPEPEVEEPEEEDIGAIAFSTGKISDTDRTLRGRKRETVYNCDEDISATKRKKMPMKEKRHIDSISPITEKDTTDENTKQRRAYNFRSRKQLYK